MERNRHTIIFLGPPGSGKGTQSGRLAEHFNIKKISTGDILREAVAKGTELGKKAKAYMEKGELVPDEIMMGLIEENIKDAVGFILDGFPRNINQAKALDGVLESRGMRISRVILLDVPDDEIVKRLAYRRVCINCGEVYNLIFNPPSNDEICDRCGKKLVQRKDDREDVLRNRIRVYKESTAPLVKYYEGKGLILRVDGKGPPSEVFERILKVI